MSFQRKLALDGMGAGIRSFPLRPLLGPRHALDLMQGPVWHVGDNGSPRFSIQKDGSVCLRLAQASLQGEIGV